jgi:hypothetical protein
MLNKSINVTFYVVKKDNKNTLVSSVGLLGESAIEFSVNDVERPEDIIDWKSLALEVSDSVRNHLFNRINNHLG